ncbi:uncharacterized protein KY384_006080 [Bacidia gigantensis]|uniref:uncharacterized protein n=1 Tax=Bacidia gigantensis TaxID=2732470 RepID=UPI001D0573B9|nr:uncharacterized protein KY384_006080 [Bacidia gigantensis]KAG8529443.1 hypothetical protein KY384_006080 [Bacidia gigantensis]
MTRAKSEDGVSNCFGVPLSQSLERTTHCPPTYRTSSIIPTPREHSIKAEESQLDDRRLSLQKLLGDAQEAFNILAQETRKETRDRPSESTGSIRRRKVARTRRLRYNSAPLSSNRERTEDALTEYVEDLVAFPPPRHPWSADEASPTDVHDRADIVERLLHDTYLRHYQNPRLSNCALRFFYKNKMFDRAQSLFLQMESLRLDIDIVTWNLMLGAYAKDGRTRRFTFLLKAMIQRGVAPNSQTWALFLGLPHSREAQEKIVAEMRARKFLEKHYIQQQVARIMTSSEITKHLALGRDSQTFCDYMRRQYGEAWMSDSAGNTIIKKIMGNPSSTITVIQAVRTLYDLKQQAFLPRRTLQIFYRACKRLDNLDLFLEILHIFTIHFGLEPGFREHEMLFRWAWRARSLNLFRTIWISAYLNNFVQSSMRTLMRRSTGEYKSATDETEPLDSFDKLAAWFATGPVPVSSERILLLKGSVATELGRATARADFLDWGIVPLLQQAISVDRNWAARGFWESARVRAELLPVRPVEASGEMESHLVSGSPMSEEGMMTAQQAFEPTVNGGRTCDMESADLSVRVKAYPSLSDAE